VTLEDVIGSADIFITATGNQHHHRRPHGADEGQGDHRNIGHFDNEIDMAGLKKVKGIQRINIKPQYDEFAFDGHSVMILAEGRLMNLAARRGIRVS
jgi:adenosylhomocysteinase